MVVVIQVVEMMMMVVEVLAYVCVCVGGIRKFEAGKLKGRMMMHWHVHKPKALGPQHILCTALAPNPPRAN